VLRRPPALLAGLVSMLAPGAGQLWLGRRRRGLLMLCVAMPLAGTAAIAWVLDPVEILRFLLRESVLLGLLVANAALCAFRLYCVIDAYGLAARERATRHVLPAAASVAGLVLLTAAPHVAAGYYDYRSYRLLGTVFADEEPEDVLTYSYNPAVFAGLKPGPPVKRQRHVRKRARSTRARWLLSPAVSGSHGLFLDDPARTSDRSSEGWFTVLLLGGDAGPYRWGLRTDTMIVVAVQEGTGRAVALGVPRNLKPIALAGPAAARYGEFDNLLNALYSFGHAHPELFEGGRDPGATALKQTISQLLGLRVQYYALVDLRGFAGMIDALGGITIEPNERVEDLVSPVDEGAEWIPIDVYPGGTYRFDGRTALAYVRSRSATSDYRRMSRQRCILSATAEQLEVRRILRGFPKLASAIERYTRTDMPIRRVPDLLQLVHSIKPWRTLSVTLGPPTYTFGGDYPDVETIRAAVRQMVLRPDLARRELGAQTARESC
jgi:LCP family protein required for cell wall assembly